MPTSLSADAIAKLDALLHAYPQAPHPGTVVGVVNKQGEMIYLKAAGAKNAVTGEAMTDDTVFWIASCTKMITGIAVMQCVERGILKLDTPISEVVPELGDMDIITASTTTSLETRKAKIPITLRMLLTHTAGFSYSWYSEHIRNWVLQQDLDEFSGRPLFMPLINEPGTKFDYGINMDWASIALEKATGQKFGDYCQENIFGPLGLKDSAFDMTDRPQMLERLSPMHKWDSKSSTFTLRDHAHLLTNVRIHSGGGGCFSTAPDYLKIVSILLNKGTDFSNGVQILKPETVEMMFTNQTANLADPGALGLNYDVPTTDTDYADGGLVLMPGQPKGWGLSFLMNLQDLPEGRKANSAEWGGIANLFWHADPTAEIGSVVFNEILPYGVPAFHKLEHDLEHVLYEPGSLVYS